MNAYDRYRITVNDSTPAIHNTYPAEQWDIICNTDRVITATLERQTIIPFETKEEAVQYRNDMFGPHYGMILGTNLVLPWIIFARIED